jgi:hypothetical protein
MSDKAMPSEITQSYMEQKKMNERASKPRSAFIFS